MSEVYGIIVDISAVPFSEIESLVDHCRDYGWPYHDEDNARLHVVWRVGNDDEDWVEDLDELETIVADIEAWLWGVWTIDCQTFPYIHRPRRVNADLEALR